ncbi:FecR family protein [Larkinella arboricola]
MKQYQKIEDFLLDDSFHAWIEGDQEAAVFWQNWRKHHPDQEEMLNQAKALVYTLKRQPDPISDGEMRQEVTRLVQEARRRKSATEADAVAERRIETRWSSWLTVAASILLVLGLGLGWRYYQTAHSPAVSYHQLKAKAPVALLEKVNHSAQPQTLLLADGSAIRLEKNSRISYPVKFSGDFREVYLSGEAFFEVAPNPRKPFLIYANETVTKVLGTSFRIRAFDNDTQVEVAVRTGKVSVYTQKTFRKGPVADHEGTGVLLIPNQEVVYNRKTESLQKSLVKIPELVATKTGEALMTFDDQPVTDVLQRLEKAYGIDIVYDEELLRHCPITAEFMDETLYQKLRFICQAVGASYEVLDGQIVISSSGCR